jgi:hypothetical protein
MLSGFTRIRVVKGFTVGVDDLELLDVGQRHENLLRVGLHRFQRQSDPPPEHLQRVPQVPVHLFEH